tara:strand:- start:2827 stop:3048 length:222 start_codon:yes stop_codon:yes gene_type:complete
MSKRTLYEKLLAIGADMVAHESDLWVYDRPDVRELVEASQLSYVESGPATSRLIDVAFAWDPYWQTRAPKVKR